MSNAESFQNGSRHFSDSVAIIEGDILLSKEQTETIMTRSGAITDVIKYWPGNTVYYTFAQDFSLQSNVEKAINEWENKTSLTFVNGTGYGNYIEFFHGSGNYSYLGTCFSYLCRMISSMRLNSGVWISFGRGILSLTLLYCTISYLK